MYVTVGVTGIDQEGWPTTISVYTDENLDVEQAHAQAIQMARQANLNPGGGFMGGQSQTMPNQPYDFEAFCDTVIRYTQVNTDKKTGNVTETPAIWFYPKWAYDNSFGLRSWTKVYLNNDQQIEEFEAATGLKLANLPIFDGNAPPQRNPGRPHSKEIVMPNGGIYVTKVEKGEAIIDGRNQMTYKFSHYGRANNPKPYERDQNR